MPWKCLNTLNVSRNSVHFHAQMLYDVKICVLRVKCCTFLQLIAEEVDLSLKGAFILKSPYARV